MDADRQRLLQIVDLAAPEPSLVGAGPLRSMRAPARRTSDRSTTPTGTCRCRVDRAGARDDSDPGDPTTAVINWGQQRHRRRTAYTFPNLRSGLAAHRCARLRRRDAARRGDPDRHRHRRRPVRQHRLHDPRRSRRPDRRLHHPPDDGADGQRADLDHRRTAWSMSVIDRRRHARHTTSSSAATSRPACFLGNLSFAGITVTRANGSDTRQLPRRGLRGRTAHHDRGLRTRGIYTIVHDRRATASRSAVTPGRGMRAPGARCSSTSINVLNRVGAWDGSATTGGRRRRPADASPRPATAGQLARRRLPRGPVGRDLRGRRLRPRQDRDHPRHQRDARTTSSSSDRSSSDNLAAHRRAVPSP